MNWQLAATLALFPIILFRKRALEKRGQPFSSKEAAFGVIYLAIVNFEIFKWPIDAFSQVMILNIFAAVGLAIAIHLIIRRTIYRNRPMPRWQVLVAFAIFILVNFLANLFFLPPFPIHS